MNQLNKLNKLNKICKKILKNLDLKEIGFSGDFSENITFCPSEGAFTLNEPSKSFKLTESTQNTDKDILIRAIIPYDVSLKNNEHITFYITCLMNAMLSSVRLNMNTHYIKNITFNRPGKDYYITESENYPGYELRLYAEKSK